MLTKTNQVNLFKKHWQKISVVVLALITVVLGFVSYQSNDKINKLTKLQKTETQLSDEQKEKLLTEFKTQLSTEQPQNEIIKFCNEFDKKLDQVEIICGEELFNEASKHSKELKDTNLQNHLDKVATDIFKNAILQFQQEKSKIQHLKIQDASNQRTAFNSIIALLQKFEKCCAFRDQVKMDFEQKAKVDSTTGNLILTPSLQYDNLDLNIGRNYLNAFSNILDLYLNTKPQITQITQLSNTSELEKKYLRELNKIIDNIVKKLYEYSNTIRNQVIPRIFQNYIN